MMGLGTDLPLNRVIIERGGIKESSTTGLMNVAAKSPTSTLPNGTCLPTRLPKTELTGR